VDTREGLEALLPTVAALCDLRQGSLHGGLPFYQDPRKAEFYLRLMDEKNLVHAVALEVGDSIAAVHIGIRSGTVVHLGLLVHSPAFAHESPGALLLHRLMEILPRDGVTRFDLTPGGSYKERLATGSNEVQSLGVEWSRMRGLGAGAYVALRAGAVNMLRRSGVDPALVVQRLYRARGRFGAVLGPVRDYQWFRLPPQPTSGFNGLNMRDTLELIPARIAHLRRRTVRDYLRDAARLMEMGAVPLGYPLEHGDIRGAGGGGSGAASWCGWLLPPAAAGRLRPAMGGAFLLCIQADPPPGVIPDEYLGAALAAAAARSRGVTILGVLSDCHQVLDACRRLGLEGVER
jgi:hypothetical protein